MLDLIYRCKAKPGFGIFKYLTLTSAQSSSVIKKYNVSMSLTFRVTHCMLLNPRSDGLNVADDVPRYHLQDWREVMAHFLYEKR